MTEHVHNLDLDLPIFPRYKSVAWSTEDIKACAKSHREKFVRRVTLQYTGATSLKAALNTADETLNRIAEYADIDVVEHRWGLSRRRPSRNAWRYDDWRLQSDFVPQGYQLVAEVANLAPLIDPPEDIRSKLCAKLNAFYYDQSIPGPKIGEIHIGAVGFHQIEKESSAAIQATILDIDPYLS